MLRLFLLMMTGKLSLLFACGVVPQNSQNFAHLIYDNVIKPQLGEKFYVKREELGKANLKFLL